MKNDKPNKQVLHELNSMVAGHLTAKKQLINLCARSKLRHYQKYIECLHDDDLISSQNLLLIGSSGTGKTYLVQCLAKLLNFPLVVFDATKFNPSPGRGETSADSIYKTILDNAKALCAKQPHYYPSVMGTVDRTIVFIDEVDKLANAFESSGKWNIQIQASLLTVIEDKYESSGVSFIFAGAFPDLTKNKIKVNKNSIGFLSQAEINKDDRIADEDLIKYGLIPEFVGRISHITQLDKFSIDDYYDILVNTVLPAKHRELDAFGIYNHEISYKQCYDIAETAYKSEQGVRALKRELDKLYLDLEFNHEEYEQDDYVPLLSKDDESIIDDPDWFDENEINSLKY